MSCNRVNGASVPITCFCTSVRGVGSQRYIQVNYNKHVLNITHFHDVMCFVCSCHLHCIWQTVTDLGSVFTTVVIHSIKLSMLLLRAKKTCLLQVWHYFKKCTLSGKLLNSLCTLSEWWVPIHGPLYLQIQTPYCQGSPKSCDLCGETGMDNRIWWKGHLNDY